MIKKFEREPFDSRPNEALEARVALGMTSVLSRSAQVLPHDISERLRFAREQALTRAREIRTQHAVATPLVVQGSGSAVLAGGPPATWWRLVSLMPLIVLVAGLIFIGYHNERELIIAAADVDAALLADELPPAAYRDPGFVAFLLSQDSE